MARSELGDVVDGILTAYKNINQPKSVLEAAKDASIISRVYLEESLLDEDVTIPLVSTINEIYCAYVLTCLNLNRYISQTNTVRDLLSVIASEEYIDVIGDVEESFGDKDAPIISMEASAYKGSVELEDKLHRFVSGKVIQLEIEVGMGRREVNATDIYEDQEHNDDKQARDSDQWSRNVNDRAIGRYTVLLYVQLIPHSFKPAVMEQFLKLNTHSSILRRFRKWRAGEIKFWRDFILCVDQVKKYQKALKEDSGPLLEIMARRAKKHKGLLGLLIKKRPSQNLINSVVIVTEETFSKICDEEHINFSKRHVRDGFFEESLCMMIAVVDTAYKVVDIYYHGLDAVGEHTFDMVNKVGSSGDSVGVKDLMDLMSKGNVPKF